MGDVTLLLNQWRDGDRDAERVLFEVVTPHLRRLAGHFMKGERPGHILQPTELVNQIYLRLVAAKDRDWRNRQHFFAIAARAMRRHLIDIARQRPDREFIAIDGLREFLHAENGHFELALDVDRLLDQVAKQQPDWCRIIEFKYFLGLTDDETAEALGMKLRTMQRMWCDARQWLFAQLETKHGGSAGA